MDPPRTPTSSSTQQWPPPGAVTSRSLAPGSSIAGTFSTSRSFQSDSSSISRMSTPFPNVHSHSAATPSTRPGTRASTIGRPSTSSGRRSRRAVSSLGIRESEDIMCALSEGRGITPSVGLCFINISTGEVVLSQICDNQFYVRTVHKLQMHEPSRILILATACPPYPKSTLYSLVEEHVTGSQIVPVDRKYWSETAGLEHIQSLAFKEDAEAIKVAIEGNFYTTCSFAAVMAYLELEFTMHVVPHSLRIRYQPSEDTMMIDISAILSLELTRNIRDIKSKNCLFGLLNQTLTPMGARMLRSNIVQPSTLKDAFLVPRYEAIEELIANEEMLVAVRKGLRGFSDVEKLLTKLIIVTAKPSIQESEQAINNVLMIKTFLELVSNLHKALEAAKSPLLSKVRDLCSPVIITPPLTLILETIQPDVAYVKSPLDLRNQRTFAVKPGTNGLLDVARQTYQEGSQDVVTHVESLKSSLNVDIALKFDNSRMYFLKLKTADFEDRQVPGVFINQIRKKANIECQTMTIKKLNQRIADSATEAILQSDKVVQELLDSIRVQVPHLFRVCESVGLLDMITSFAQVATLKGYSRPDITGTLALKSARHPLLDTNVNERFVPNDYYATEQHRFQIITGPNMSGKSTYIRSIALLQIMAQIGSFVPADYAAFPIIHKVFSRVTTDDSIESNLSTFSLEMREMAFILRNIDGQSIAIIDELGRGTSTRDGLSIALAISEALIQSNAIIWFATHFIELADVLGDRPGVMNLHLATRTASTSNNTPQMTMLYKVATGPVKERGYGIALAKAIGFPDEFIQVAERVSKELAERAEAREQSAELTKAVHRRKLILNLHETLKQVAESDMDDEAMRSFLVRLQEEFIRKMTDLEGNGSEGSDDDEGGSMSVDDGESSRIEELDEGDEGEDVDMSFNY